MVITTVCGDVAPADLGVTTMHEHTLFDLTMLADAHGAGRPTPPAAMLALEPRNLAFLRSGAGLFSPECRIVDDVDYLVGELTAFRDAGGRAVADASPIGARGDVAGMAAASAASGVHIVCATGVYYAGMRPPVIASLDEDALAAYLLREATDGIGETGIRPGFVKAAQNVLGPDGRIHPDEVMSIRACARVAGEAGLSLHIHTGFPLTADHVEQAIGLVVDEVGLPPERVVMLHLDSLLRRADSALAYVGSLDTTKGVDIDAPLRALDRGVNVSFDSWGAALDTPGYMLPDDHDRMKGLFALVERGYEHQLVVGHDLANRACGVQHGGHGFLRAPQYVPLMLGLLGRPDAAASILTANPARILTWEAAPPTGQGQARDR